ncbi:hypothetical protein MMC31_003923 [Peltigera leucophlebia]|nr:hypothetical protein [Peltigera leucophlebia]
MLSATQEKVKLRSRPLQNPTTPLASFNRYPHFIKFKHPGYSDDAKNTLLRLYAIDHENNGPHINTAFVACAIVAGNSWNGYFTDGRNGERIHMEPDELLLKDTYYFYVPNDVQYAVYPSFSEWVMMEEE